MTEKRGSSVTIQLNSYAALERLIGGNTELEIDIRNSIVQKFTEKHLKGLANNEWIKDAEKRIANEILQDVGKISKHWGVDKVELSKSTKDAIADAVRTQFQNVMYYHINRIAGEMINTPQFKEDVKAHVQAVMVEKVQVLVSKELKEGWDLIAKMAMEIKKEALKDVK